MSSTVHAGTGPGAALRDVSEAVLERVTAKASRKTEDWTRRLNEVAAPDGATDRAGYEGLKTALLGGNPVWAALKGAWSGSGTNAKVLAVVSLVLMLLVAPVPTLLLLLGLLGAGLVMGVRALVR
jgi:hypothetical protein